MSWGQHPPQAGGLGPDPYGPGSGTYGRPYMYQYDAAHPPRPAVGFSDAIKLFFKNTVIFHGRASRSEFWWVQLGGLILTLLLVIPIVVVVAVAGAGSQDPPAALGIYVLLLVVLGMCLALPSVSLQVRRLHDAGFSGFFSIFAYIPYLSSITFLVPLIMSIMAPSPEGVKYDNPNGSQPVAPGKFDLIVR